MCMVQKKDLNVKSKIQKRYKLTIEFQIKQNIKNIHEKFVKFEFKWFRKLAMSTFSLTS